MEEVSSAKHADGVVEEARELAQVLYCGRVARIEFEGTGKRSRCPLECVRDSGQRPVMEEVVPERVPGIRTVWGKRHEPLGAFHLVPRPWGRRKLRPH